MLCRGCSWWHATRSATGPVRGLDPCDKLTWQRRTESTGTGPADEEVWLLPAGPQTIDGMTPPQNLDQLPTDPAELDPDGRPGDIRTVMFDTRTAEITEENDYVQGELLFSRTVPVFEVVDALPSDIREHAVVQK
jgi:hypothetical protein